MKLMMIVIWIDFDGSEWILVMYRFLYDFMKKKYPGTKLLFCCFFPAESNTYSHIKDNDLFDVSDLLLFFLLLLK